MMAYIVLQTLVLGKDRKTCENPNIFEINTRGFVQGQGLPKVVYTEVFDGGFRKG